MLQVLRDRSRGRLVRLFLVLSALSFVAFYIVEAARNYHASRPVAKIGKKSIGFDYYLYQVQRTIQDIRSKNSKVTADDLKRMNIFQNVLDEQIKELVISQELENHKLFVPDNMLQSVVHSLPLFHKEGKFDESLFQNYLQASRTSEMEFIGRIKRHLLLQQIMQPLGEKIILPDTYLQTLLRILFTPHHFKVMKIDFNQMHIDQNPNEDDLLETYQKNKEKYQVPESRQISFLSFKSSDLIKKIPVSEDEIKHAYEENKDKFKEAEKRSIHQLTYPTQSMAKMACDYLKTGDLSTVFISVPGGQYKNLGTLTKDKAPQTFAHILFDPKVKRTAPPLQTPEGYVVFYIDSIQKARTLKFEEVHAKLLQEIRLEKSTDFVGNFRNTLEDKLGAGISLEQVAEESKVILIKKTVRQKQNNLKEFEKNGELEEEIFRLQKAQVSPVLELDSGLFYVVRVDSIKNAYTPKLKNIKKRVHDDWITSKKKKEAKLYASKMQKITLKDIKEPQFPLEPQIIRSIDVLTGQVKNLPEYSVRQMLSLSPQKAVTFEATDKETLYVVWYEKSDHLKKLPKEAKEIGKKLKDMIDTEALILRAMEGQYEKKIYPNAMKDAKDFFK